MQAWAAKLGRVWCGLDWDNGKWEPPREPQPVQSSSPPPTVALRAPSTGPSRACAALDWPCTQLLLNKALLCGVALTSHLSPGLPWIPHSLPAAGQNPAPTGALLFLQPAVPASGVRSSRGTELLSHSSSFHPPLLPACAQATDLPLLFLALFPISWAPFPPPPLLLPIFSVCSRSSLSLIPP